jgi:dihydropteroate synthase
MKPVPQPFSFGSRVLDLSVPQVMGILNITPDSFSDGGELLADGRPDLDGVLRRAEAMVAAGATLLDIGGESTRPGATAISVQEELDRVLPVLDVLRPFAVVLSVDTSSPELMRAAAAHGAGLINDVRALERHGALAAAAVSGLPVCLMHRQGEPETMQDAPVYRDVVSEVCDYLQARVQASLAAGIGRERLLLDPGFGFGKTLVHNLQLLDGLEALQVLELPVLIGLSRKRMLGALTGKSGKERVAAGVAAAVIAVIKGACIVRTHDVDATMDAMKVCRALQELPRE